MIADRIPFFSALFSFGDIATEGNFWPSTSAFDSIRLVSCPVCRTPDAMRGCLWMVLTRRMKGLSRARPFMTSIQ
eukprot:scaffold1881_cov256-Pinguiococcus_pyrenoidosus.AAC.3